MRKTYECKFAQSDCQFLLKEFYLRQLRLLPYDLIGSLTIVVESNRSSFIKLATFLIALMEWKVTGAFISIVK